VKQENWVISIGDIFNITLMTFTKRYATCPLYKTAVTKLSFSGRMVGKDELLIIFTYPFRLLFDYYKNFNYHYILKHDSF
jgi:hypothetical protein